MEYMVKQDEVVMRDLSDPDLFVDLGLPNFEVEEKPEGRALEFHGDLTPEQIVLLERRLYNSPNREEVLTWLDTEGHDYVALASGTGEMSAADLSAAVRLLAVAVIQLRQIIEEG